MERFERRLCSLVRSVVECGCCGGGQSRGEERSGGGEQSGSTANSTLGSSARYSAERSHAMHSAWSEGHCSPPHHDSHAAAASRGQREELHSTAEHNAAA